MRTRLTSLIAASAAALFLVACGDDGGGDTIDARPTDARVDATDIEAAIDAPMIDAPIDAPIDAAIDAAIDAPIDAAATPSELIAAAVAAADGSGLTLPIAGATVTYIKPQIGSTTNDPAGFTIQASQDGPALMVAVDPATLTPVIQSYGTKLQAVFAENAEMAMGALLALEQAKLKDKVLVVGVDAIADALKAVKHGRLDATVFQDAKGQGGSAVDTALKLARGQPCEKEVFIPFQLVTKENIAQYAK